MTHARVGVIGTGWWATQAHIPSLKTYEKADLVGLADSNPDKLAKAASFYEIENTYIDYHDLLENVQGVIIAVPHVFHYEIARDALDSGVHVLVEKPMALTAAHAWDLVKRAEANAVELMVGTTFQFTDHARRIRDIVQSGGIGDLLHVSGLFASMVESFLRSNPEAYRTIFDYSVTPPSSNTYSDPNIAGGGQGQTQLSHAMGMVFWVTGCRAIETFAYMGNFDLEVDLVDAISYRLDNGALGTMGASGSVHIGQPENQEFRYYGTEGQIRQDVIHGRSDVHYNNGDAECFKNLAKEDIYRVDLPARVLVDLILGEGENLASGAAAARCVEFLEASYKSAQIGRAIRIDSLI